MKLKVLIWVILAILLINGVTAYSYTAITEGTRSVKYNSTEFKNLIDLDVFETKRNVRFANSIGNIYSGGRRDTGRALGLKLDSKAIGVIAHGKAFYEFGGWKTLTYEMLKGKYAQFEYAPENLVFTAPQLKFYVNKLGNGVKVLTVEADGTRAVIEQNGVRIKSSSHKSRTYLKIIQDKKGKQRAYFSLQGPHKAIVLDKNHKETWKNQTIKQLIGRVPPKKRADLTILVLPFEWDKISTEIGGVKFKHAGLGKKGFVRYEEKFKPHEKKVFGTDFMITQGSGVTVEVVDLPRRKDERIVLGTQKSERMLLLEKGKVRFYSDNGYYKCHPKYFNCIRVKGDNVAINFWRNDMPVKLHLFQKDKSSLGGNKPAIKNINIKSLSRNSVIKVSFELLGDTLWIKNKEIKIVPDTKENPIVTQWYDFDLSFKMPLYFYSKKHILDCDTKKKVCKVDGKETLSGIGVRVCPWVKCYSNIEKCVSNICVQTGVGCKPHDIKGSSKYKYDVLVVGDGFSNHMALINHINKYVERALKVKAFSRIRHKINIYSLSFKPGELPRDKDGGGVLSLITSNKKLKKLTASEPSIDKILKIKEQLCNHADSVITLSGGNFRSYAYRSGYIQMSNELLSQSLTLAHEMGHSFGGLDDEYYSDILGERNPGTGINCVETRAEALKKFRTDKYQGCGGDCGEDYNCADFYRPSYNSIMKYQMPIFGSEFNSFSSNYIHERYSRYR